MYDMLLIYLSLTISKEKEMSLKSVLIALSVLSIFGLALWISSCGSDESAKIDCNKVCDKEKECDSQMTDEDVKSCISHCNKLNDSGYVQDSYINAGNDCYGKSCSEIDTCMEKASDGCKAPDYMPYINAICDKLVSCDSNIKKEDCVSEAKKSFEGEMSGSVKCLTDKAFTDSANCVKNAKCETLQDDAQKCMEDIFN